MRSPKQCFICKNSFVPSHPKVKCCCRTCTNLYRMEYCKVSQETKNKLSFSLKEYFRKNGVKTKGEEHSVAVGLSVKGTSGKTPESLLDISSRTARKILKRLKIGCSRCGWKEGTCDLHHIHGKKIPEANHHRNLTYICPNCHRLFHEKKITEKDVCSLEQQISDSWKDHYYG